MSRKISQLNDVPFDVTPRDLSWEKDKLSHIDIVFKKMWIDDEISA